MDGVLVSVTAEADYDTIPETCQRARSRLGTHTRRRFIVPVVFLLNPDPGSRVNGETPPTGARKRGLPHSTPWRRPAAAGSDLLDGIVDPWVKACPVFQQAFAGDEVDLETDAVGILE